MQAMEVYIVKSINIYDNRDIFRFPPRGLFIQSKLMINTLVTSIIYMNEITTTIKRDLKTDDT